MVVAPVVPPIIEPPMVMPKAVAARPATVETSAMSRCWRTGLIRLKSEPRVIGPHPRCQAALDDFFATTTFGVVSDQPRPRELSTWVEFFA